MEVSLMLYLKDKGPVSGSFYNRIVNIKVPLVALRPMPSTNTIYDTMILDIKLASKIELRLIWHSAWRTYDDSEEERAWHNTESR